MLKRILSTIRALFKMRPTTYCICGSEAVFPMDDPEYCEFCYPAVWRRHVIAAEDKP